MKVWTNVRKDVKKTAQFTAEGYMFLIADITLSNEVMAIIGTLVTVIGVLITVIAWFFWGKIKEVEESLTALEKQSAANATATDAKIQAIQTNSDIKIAALDVRMVNKHDTTTARVFERIEANEKLAVQNEKEIRRDISDINVTVAGFGGAYTPRREFEDFKKEN